MERSRITPRLRPRPYDLRRKVLLKNFFREQMTYIPNIRSAAEASLDVNNDSEVDENDANTNEGNILTPKNVQDNIVTPISVPEPSPSTSTTSNCSEKENSNNPDSSVDEISSNMSEAETRPASKFSRLSQIIQTIDSRLSSKKNRRKGITKAKHELRSSKCILKPAGRKIIKDTEITSKPKTKTFFERFKSRKDKKRNKSTMSKITNLFAARNSPSKCNTKVATTTTQSVQTDVSWSPDHYEQMEKSNRSLLEENRLLSESLSSIITNKTDYLSSSMQNSCCTDSYTNNNDNSTAYFSSEQKPVNKSVYNESHYQPDNSSRTRILRSKSMQNRSEKRHLASSRHRPRSLTFRYAKKPYNADSFFTNEPHYSEQEPYRVHPVTIPIPSRAKKRPSVLQGIVAPPLCHTNTPPLPKTLPSKSSKGITRRASMPERTYNWSYRARPARSSSLRENNRYSYVSERLSTRPTHRRRSSTFDSYSVPFQDLPAEAFY